MTAVQEGQPGGLPPEVHHGLVETVVDHLKHAAHFAVDLAVIHDPFVSPNATLKDSVAAKRHDLTPYAGVTDERRFRG